MNRDRFPGLRDGWARLDGPAGSQMVDTAIDAMTDWMRSGSQANHGGAFKAAHDTDELVHSTRAACAALLGGEPEGIAFGPSFTALTMRFSATVVRELQPGDEIVCTRLDHDSNVRPWVIAAERAGRHVCRPCAPVPPRAPRRAGGGVCGRVPPPRAPPHRRHDMAALDADVI